MIATYVLAALLQAPAPEPAADPLTCAFERGKAVGAASAAAADALADKIVAECTTSAPGLTEQRLASLRIAARVGIDHGRNGDSAAEGQASPGGSGEIRDTVTSRIDIPDEIAPALMPYMQCLGASAGTLTFDHQGREILPPAGMARGTDCRPIRRRAAEEGSRLLKKLRRGSRSERKAYVEEALASIDRYQAATVPAEGGSTE